MLIKKVISETPEALNANVRYELDLRERTIRVEEELKHQRELMAEGFKQVDKKFNEMGKRLDRFMFCSLGITVSCAIFVVNFLK